MLGSCEQASVRVYAIFKSRTLQGVYVYKVRERTLVNMILCFSLPGIIHIPIL